MKIYGQQPPEKDSTVATLTASVTGKDITVSLVQAKVTFTLPKATEIIGVYEGTNPESLYTMSDNERFASRDSVSMAMETQGITNVTTFVALVAVSSSGVYVVTRHPLNSEIKGAVYLEPAALEMPREFLKTVDPELRAFVTKSKAKRKLLSGLTPTDSLSALEKQVDLLTMLVLSLARKQPAAEQPAWLDELETVFADTSSVQEDALEKAVASMGEYKAHIRALQEEYFRNRSTT